MLSLVRKNLMILRFKNFTKNQNLNTKINIFSIITMISISERINKLLNPKF